MKHLIVFMLILFSVPIVSAGTNITGTGGDLWSGNYTPYQVYENIDSHIELDFESHTVNQSNVYSQVAFNSIYNGMWVGQSFNITETRYVTILSTKLYRRLNPTEDLVVEIYAEDGSDKPTGSALASQSFAPADVSAATNIMYNYTFSQPFKLTAGTKYIIIARSAAANSTHCYRWGVNTSNTGYVNGTNSYSTDQGSSWTSGSYDTPFEIYVGNHYLSGNITRNYTSIIGVSEELQYLKHNGSDGTSILNTDLYSSVSNVTYHLIQANETPNTNRDVSGNSYEYGRWNLKTTDTSQSPIIYNVTGVYGTGIGSVNITYYNLDYDNLTANVLINISNKTGVLTYINLTHIGNLSSTYCLNYPNGTAVQACVTCTGEGDTIWFNGSADRLPEAINYSINETEAVSTSTIIIPASSWGMFNNWTVATTFSAIAANESNDVCYTYYNVSNGEWESHYPPYSWNADYVIPLEASVMVYVNAETTVIAYTVTPANTNLYTSWNMLFVEDTDNESVSSIIADIGANCTDVWWFNSTAGAYSNTTSDTVQPCQGFLAYLTQDMIPWIRSDL